MTTPLFDAIHHVAIIASDYPRSRHFYHQVLGLPIIAETLRAERQSWKLDLALPDGSQLELFSFPAPPPRPSRPEACGLRHLAFRVADLDRVIAVPRPGRGVQNALGWTITFRVLKMIATSRHTSPAPEASVAMEDIASTA